METTRTFIDTNIVVHWMILSKIKGRAKESKELWTRYDRIKPSFELMTRVLENKDNSKQFFASELSAAEIYYGLYDEARCSKMFLDGVPFSSWGRAKDGKNFSLTHADINDIYRSVNQFFSISAGKIKIVKDSYVFRNVAIFVLKEKLRTHDAILLSEAMKSNCDYFVTNDSDFNGITTDALKYTKDDGETENILKIIKPNDYNHKFFKMT